MRIDDLLQPLESIAEALAKFRRALLWAMLRKNPVTKVLDSCVGCGLCGEVAHAAKLCPSFYRASIIENPSQWDRLKANIRDAVIGFLQRRLARKAAFA